MDPRLDNNLPIRNTPGLALGLSNKMFFLLVKSIFSIYGKGESFLQLNSKCLVKKKISQYAHRLGGTLQERPQSVHCRLIELFWTLSLYCKSNYAAEERANNIGRDLKTLPSSTRVTPIHFRDKQ